eukprot:scaffold284024_cov32-Prasinocladus_malaysianus.AAC.2
MGIPADAARDATGPHINSDIEHSDTAGHRAAAHSEGEEDEQRKSVSIPECFLPRSDRYTTSPTQSD